MQSARIVTLSLILLELFPLELCPSQKQLSMTILCQAGPQADSLEIKVFFIKAILGKIKVMSLKF